MLSIITITYNDPNALAATCASLEPFAATCAGRGRRWQHVIVDGSPAVNAGVIAGLKNWPLKHVVREARGVYTAMNDGIAEAEGDQLWFLNGGDRAADARVALDFLGEFARDAKLDLVIGAAERWQGGRLRYATRPRGSFLGNLLGYNRVCHQAVIYRRELFARMGAYSDRYPIAGDYEHLVRAYVGGARARMRTECLARVDAGGVSDVRWGQSMAEFREISRELLAPKLNPVQRWRNEGEWAAKVAELRLLKRVKASPLNRLLQPIWIWWKRG
ncbi:MAG: glycosyltransferase [Bacteriovoracia bacterium]